MNKRTIISLAACIITFTLGIAIGRFEITWGSTSQSAGEQPRETTIPIDHSKFANSGELNLREIRFVCNDELLRPFWIDLLREPRFTSRLLLGPLQNIYDCAELMQVEEKDLNDDGKTEYVILLGGPALLCGAKANCPTAVYGIFDDERSKMKTTAGTFDFSRRLLLYSEGDFRFEVKKSARNGYHDLRLQNNGGNNNDSLQEYSFDGIKYQLVKCYELTKPDFRTNRVSCE